MRRTRMESAPFGRRGRTAAAAALRALWSAAFNGISLSKLRRRAFISFLMPAPKGLWRHFVIRVRRTRAPRSVRPPPSAAQPFFFPLPCTYLFKQCLDLKNCDIYQVSPLAQRVNSTSGRFVHNLNYELPVSSIAAKNYEASAALTS